MSSMASTFAAILLLCVGFSPSCTQARRTWRTWHRRPASAELVAPRPLCDQEIGFVVEDPLVTHNSDVITPSLLQVVLDTVDTAYVKTVRLRMTGIPCARKGCCEHRILARPQGSDGYVLGQATKEYSDFLLSYQLHANFSSILDAGGNMGAATILFAHLFPDAVIVALEPQEMNCMLLKANTLGLPNVRVHCQGLWDHAAKITITPGGDQKEWAWQTQEAPSWSPQSSKIDTTTVLDVLERHSLDHFDFVKLDIEGAEYKVLGNHADTSWLDDTQLLAIEFHGASEDIWASEAMLRDNKFLQTASGEYSVFARKKLLDSLVMKKSWSRTH